MIKMFSKSRSSRRKEKNQDGSTNSQKLDIPRGTQSLSRAQAAMYSNNTSPARGPGGHNYPDMYDGSNSLERSNRSRAMSDGSVSDYPISSPLDFPMEHLQSFSATYGLSPAQKTYIDSRSVPRHTHTPVKSLVSPTHHGRSLSSSRGGPSISQHPSQSYARANSTSSLGQSSYRDRSLDRMERDNSYLGDRSLDRQFEQIHYSMQMDNRLNHPDPHYNTTARERSLDREYPHMGARSLERDPSSVSRSRSMDRGGEYNYPSATLPTMPLMSHPPSVQNERSSHEFRNSLVFEMQVQISDLHKEVSKLQKELDQSREKLSSSMNSIKTFWSPELKKERAVRKEEAAKCNLLNEQLKVTQAELKKHREMLRDLETRIQGGARVGASSPGAASSESSASEVTNLKEEREAQCRELLILKRTVEELEIRIDSQKQTLEARDESIKKLLEMLSNKGTNVTKVEEDRQAVENLRSRLKEEEQKKRHLEDEMRDKDTLIIQLNLEVSQIREGQSQGSIYAGGDHLLRAKLEAKDSRISSLENEVQQLEDRLLRAKEDSAGIPSPSSSSSSQSSARDAASSHRDLASAKEKLLRVEIQALKNEGSKKDAEMEALRLKLEASERQQMERGGYVSVLKDQISSKESQVTMLQADIEGLQERVKSKDKTMEAKSKELLISQSEKRRTEIEILELKDQLEIKANRVNTLQRKIEGLEDTIREKEDQLSQARIRLTSTFTESSTSSLESGVIADKDRQIERLKEQREQTEKEHQEEIDLYVKSSQDLKGRLDLLQKDLNSRQTEICELREQNVELQGKKFELEGKIRKLDSELSERHVEYQRLTLELEESKMKLDEKSEAEKQKKEEDGQPANFNQQESKQLQDEIHKLHDMLKEAEADKIEKESEIKELSEAAKENKQKMGTLKRNQQTEKKKNAQLLEEARKREDTMSDDASHMTSVIKKSTGRVEELEEALRQSVIITAQREMAMAELQSQIEETNAAMEELRSELDALHLECEEDKEKLALLSIQLADKDQQLTKLREERQGHMEDVYEMKQEAIQAMISEKDSTLALLELTSTKNQKNMEEIERLTKDKHKLQVQLRDVMSNRMRLREPPAPEKPKGRSSRANSRQNSPTRVSSRANSRQSSPTRVSSRANSRASSPSNTSKVIPSPDSVNANTKPTPPTSSSSSTTTTNTTTTNSNSVSSPTGSNHSIASSSSKKLSPDATSTQSFSPDCPNTNGEVPPSPSSSPNNLTTVTSSSPSTQESNSIAATTAATTTTTTTTTQDTVNSPS